MERAAVTAADLAANVASAHASCTPLRIVGGASWLDAGRPCTGDMLNVGEYAGIVEYVPGDLTLTARAGTTLADLNAITAEHGQWLALDPAADARATLGATVATASDGPLAISMGRVRDLVLGLECITGKGEITRAGGRVVKNVAGFDLVRLHTGAWGTLGVITEVTVRLRARSDVDRAFVIAGDARASLESRLAPLADLPIAPLALELLSGALAHALGLHDGICLLVRLAGNEERVAAQASSLQALGDVREVPVNTFERLAALEPSRAVAARITHMPTQFAGTWRHVMQHLDAFECWQPLVRGSVTRGLVRVVIPLADDVPSLPAQRSEGFTSAFVQRIAPPGAHAAWERLPAEAWAFVESAVNDRLSMGVRRALDPAHILNRGVFGEARSEASSTT